MNCIRMLIILCLCTGAKQEADYLRKRICENYCYRSCKCSVSAVQKMHSKSNDKMIIHICKILENTKSEPV